MRAACGNKTATAIYSAAHLAVDFCCAAAVFSAARSACDGGLLFLIYNFCAFALQLPLGAAADTRGHAPLFAAVGCMAVGAGCLLPSYAAAVVAGIGNAAFHVGAGVDILHRSKDTASMLGIFVSPGAIGVFLGSILTYHILTYIPVLCLITAFFAPAILLLCGKGEERLPTPFYLPEKGVFVALGLFAVVLLRSAGGFAMSFPWKSGGWAYAFTLCVVLGKALGGMLGDRLGSRPAALLSLAGAALLFFFADASPAAGILAALLFNMTMPLTLHAAARLLGDYKGTAFGLLTLGLFVGLLPSYTGFGISGGLYCAVLSLLSLLLLLPCLKKEDV